MKRCPNCSHENNDNMSFCLECGTPLPNAPMVFNLQNDAEQTGSLSGAAPPTNFGANRQTANFARHQPNYIPNYQQPTMPQTKSKLPLIIGGVISLLLLLGFAGAAVVVYNLQSDKKAVVDVKPTPVASPELKDNKSPSPAPSVSLKSSPNTTNPNVAPQVSFTPPLEPTKQGSFTVHANTGWQLSDIDVVASEEFTTNVQGMIDLAGIKASVSSSGVNDAKTKSRRIYQEYPTGALLMRTRYADGKTSNTIAMTTNGANGSWQNFPYEIGKLEFCINDNAPEQNGGQFIVTKTTTPPRAPKRK